MTYRERADFCFIVGLSYSRFGGGSPSDRSNRWPLKNKFYRHEEIA